MAPTRRQSELGIDIPTSLASAARRTDWPLVATGLALALAIVAVVTVAVGATFAFAVPGDTIANDLPNYATSAGAFIGFLAAGMFVSRRARHDRILHAVMLVLAGYVAALVITLVDQSFGSPIERAMPGSNMVDSQVVHLGFWVVNWVVLPASALLGASAVPRREEGWGSYDHEPEDLEL